jgi:exosortase
LDLLLKNKQLMLSFAVIFTAISMLYWPIIVPMAKQWASDDNYSHGFLVPIISLYLAYMRKNELQDAVIRPCNYGILLVAFGLLLLVLGWIATEYLTMRSSLVVVIAGLILYLLGWEIFKILLAPLCYLFLMVPIPAVLYDAAAFPLKLFVTNVSVLSMKALGIVVWQEGNILMFPNITLEVADACSGLRSIMSLLALGAAYALVLHTKTRDRVILIISTLPIAILTNTLRVVATGVLAQFFGSAAAEGFFHEFAGLFVFAAAVVLFVALGSALKRWA